MARSPRTTIRALALAACAVLAGACGEKAPAETPSEPNAGLFQQVSPGFRADPASNEEVGPDDEIPQPSHRRADAIASGKCPEPAPKIGSASLPAKPTTRRSNLGWKYRDDRRVVTAPRARVDLETETQGLESEVRFLEKNDPSRPGLVRRLAETYVELASAASIEKAELLKKAASARRVSPGLADGYKRESEKPDAIAKEARDAAIRHYSDLRTKHPKWCQNANAKDPKKSTGCADEVLNNLALEFERAGRLEDARKAYFEIVQNWAESKLVPNAYLAFGEDYFDEAPSNPTKWDLAKASYEEVIKYPPPDNKVFGYAHYKLGYVYWNKGDFARSMSEFKKTIEYGVAYTQLDAGRLAALARRDILPIYALAGDPKRAHDFLKPLAGDSGGQSDQTFEMMNRLGEIWQASGHLQEATALYDDLAVRDTTLRKCYEAVLATLKAAVIAASPPRRDPPSPPPPPPPASRRDACLAQCRSQCQGSAKCLQACDTSCR